MAVTRGAAMLLVALLAGCASPSSKSSSKSEAGADSDASAQSHQGTSATPIIVVCNQLINGPVTMAECVRPSGDAEPIVNVIEASKASPKGKK